mmetsp:Transcript_17462/g.42880  ORF Transcript_17462/g.42880 Transcript_17462/m.42880 type:complete len:108 (-) Transcript_17462:3602-3925(-)
MDLMTADSENRIALTVQQLNHKQLRKVSKYFISFRSRFGAVSTPQQITSLAKPNTTVLMHMFPLASCRLSRNGSRWSLHDDLLDHQYFNSPITEARCHHHFQHPNVP